MDRLKSSVGLTSSTESPFKIYIHKSGSYAFFSPRIFNCLNSGRIRRKLGLSRAVVFLGEHEKRREEEGN